ncbi:hypothetical protein HID58_003032 [Brassica napus]|uniref:Uncharacterized protein n=1 Tax=Brassica napus TaxID=3708 RepID=A0ABQ8EP52_BRANA|nr:hypothetical protein HID58_003032 [Brassica napus]
MLPLIHHLQKILPLENCILLVNSKYALRFSAFSMFLEVSTSGYIASHTVRKLHGLEGSDDEVYDLLLAAGGGMSVEVFNRGVIPLAYNIIKKNKVRETNTYLDGVYLIFTCLTKT